MKPKITTMLFFILFLCSEGCGASTLSTISRIEHGGFVEILAFFDEVPFYDAQISGNRLDITLLNTVIGSDLVIPESDEIIARTQLREDNNALMLTIFLRYSPQQIKIDPGPANSITVSLVPGNRFTKTYQTLVAGFGPLINDNKEPKTIVEPLTFSPYAADWRLFLEQNHGYSFVELSPHITFPPFPLTALLSMEQPPEFENLSGVSDELSGDDLFDALAEVQNRLQNRSAGQERRHLALTYADLLYRLGNSRAAHEQFSILKDKYPDKEIGILADYARIIIEAQKKHFYKAQILLERSLEQQSQNSKLAPYIRLTLVECFLASEQYKKAQAHLEATGPLPEKTALIRDIRRGDLLIKTERFEQAETILDRYADSAQENLQPYSLNNYCTMLFERNRFMQSSRCYQSLETKLLDPKEQANARYLSVLSLLQYEDDPAIDDRLVEIINDFPGSQAALRAEIKQADLCYLQKANCNEEALGVYQKIAENSISRDIAQEAYFKAALIHHLSGDDHQAVTQLDTLLRNYQSGRLRDEAMALLLDTLPGVLSKMLGKNQHIQALSLAQKNRDLFINDWIEHSLLFKLGLAFEELSLYHDALHLFLYLKRFDDFQLDEQLLSALTRVSHALGNHRLVEDFSGTYLLHFPYGEHHQDVTFYLIDSTLAAGQIDRALKLLPKPLPKRRDFQLLAASIHFFVENYEDAADLLRPLTPYSELSGSYRFILAESLLHMGQDQICVEIYEQLLGNKAYMGLAHYRLTQIFQKDQKMDYNLRTRTYFELKTGQNYWHRLSAQQQKFNQLMQTL